MNDSNRFAGFLCKAKSFIKTKPTGITNVHFVLGNESADLDSIVSAIVYAFFLHERDKDVKTVYIPVVCIPEDDINLRTAVISLFKKFDICCRDIVYKDEVNYGEFLRNSTVSVTLVDHNHIGCCGILKNYVCNIVDHHKDSLDIINIPKNIKMVGSCCTLVAEEIHYGESKLFSIYPIPELLLAGILVDTLNLDHHSTNVLELDVFMAEILSQHTDENPDQLFSTIQKAKLDISSMSSHDILRKDYKDVPSVTSTRIGISSITLEYSKFIKRDDCIEAIRNFNSKKKIQALVLMFQHFNEESALLREMAIASEDETLLNKISNYLLSTKELNPKDITYELSGPIKSSMRLLKQQHVKPSRKFILPLLQKM